MKILITGAGGYIGSIATYLFLQHGYEIITIDNFSTGYKQPLELLQKKFGKNKLKIYEADLRKDISHIFKKEKNIKAVVHYAASCLVDDSMQRPAFYFENNLCGSTNLLKTMLEHGITKIVFSSTCAVYGETKYVPVDEKHPTNPTNPYGESKRMVEKVIEWLGKLKGLNYVILRYFNVCGASDDGLLGDSKKPSPHLMQNAVRGALGIEPFYLTCPKVNTPDGTPIRDYVNVVDLNEAHLKAVELLLKNSEVKEIINLGTGKGNSVLEIIEKVQEITGVKFDLNKGQTRAGEYAKIFASNEKAKKILGWQPKRSIEHSVKSMVKWYTTHPKGWEY